MYRSSNSIKTLETNKLFLYMLKLENIINLLYNKLLEFNSLNNYGRGSKSKAGSERRC